MSTYPRLEARISAQERRHLILDARIEELSEDTKTSIKQLSDDVKHLSDDMKASFKQLADYQIQTEHQIDARFNQVNTRLDTLEMLLTQILNRLPEKPQSASEE